MALTAAACSSTGAVPRPFPTPGSSPPRTAVPASPGTPAEAPATASVPPEAPAAPGTPVRPDNRARSRDPQSVDSYALTGTALSLRGIPYRNGGTDPNGFDCSGFTQYVFGQHGLALPREVRDQYAKGKTVKPEDITMGDLLFFSTIAPGASHVGIALGGDTFVHAPSSTGVVRVERLTSTYWSQRFVGARRLM